MTGFTKEICFVSGDDVDQVDQLTIANIRIEYPLTVLGKGRDMQTVQAALDPNLEHRFLIGAQIDSGFVVDQVAQPFKISMG
jgi:hypothetical protein